MRKLLFLTWRYITFHKIKSIILLICISLTLTFPLAIHFLVKYYERSLVARASSTPLILGAKGNRFSLTLKSLYYMALDTDQINWQDHLDAEKTAGLASIPIYLGFTASGRQIVGSTHEYFEFRNMELEAGDFPLRLEDAVLGARVARNLTLGPGDHILTDKKDLFNLLEYPLQMRITGVLSPTGTPDDDAIITDIKTTWIISGHVHGHMDLQKTKDESLIQEKNNGIIVGSPQVQEYTSINPKNILSFHEHADPKELPVTALILAPENDKVKTLFMTAVNQDSKTLQVIEPLAVINNLIGIVFKVKQFFDANFLLTSLVTILFLLLVFMLSSQIREKERITLYKIGCSRQMLFWLQASEIAVITLGSIAIAGTFSVIGLALASHFRIFG